MPDYINKQTIWFLLDQTHNVDQLFTLDRYSDFDHESMKMFIDSVEEFGDRVLYPAFREMDEKPAHLANGKVLVHETVSKYLLKAGELGLIGGTFDIEKGGLQLPSIFHNAAIFILEAANNNLPGYAGLTAGAADLIASFGNDELKKVYVPNMLAGKWCGTMCLTEPQAGSSLSDISSTATPNDDGTYSIDGQKIFISGGDHQYSENIIHMVLARIEGAPAGTKGISLFVVPKFRIEKDGSLVSNDVETIADFPKLGQRGYCTTHLGFGAANNCTGWLIGEQNKGLLCMFQMMNEARIAVGRGAVSIICAAYHASLAYARERPQGRRLNPSGKKDADEDQTLIINHPDVRRMLLSQKAIYEGSLSLIFQASIYNDLMLSSYGDEKEINRLLLEIITPIAKTYPSEMGIQSVSNGLQILGGYGYCSEYILQQYYRDIRISAIYEGTTGIQSIDLLGRKMTMEDGKAAKLLFAEIFNCISGTKNYNQLKTTAATLAEKLELTDNVFNKLLQFASDKNFDKFLANATVFMDFMGTLVIGWQWLKIGVAACEGLNEGKSKYSDEFYNSKLKTMDFFFIHELTRMDSMAHTLLHDPGITIPEGNPIEF